MKFRYYLLCLIIYLLFPSHVFSSSWTTMNSGTTSSSLYGVWGSSGSDVFAVGLDGTILHYDGSNWSPMYLYIETGFYLARVWGSSGNDVFVVGTGIYHYDGYTWSSMTYYYYPNPPLLGVWGSSPNDVFAVNLIQEILHYDGSNWTLMESPTQSNHFDVWGSSSNDVFSVGGVGSSNNSNAAIFHYDGSNWSFIVTGTPPLLYGVWGSSGSDVFAVGGGGTILHYDGNEWHSMNSGTTEFLYGVWGSSWNNVFAVGSNGTILHYDGNSWSPMNSGTAEVLYDVWGSSANDVFAVGDNGTILHYGGEGAVKPIIVSGDIKTSIDIVFVPSDEYDDLSTFEDQARDIINNAYYPLIEEKYRDRINFWYSTIKATKVYEEYRCDENTTKQLYSWKTEEIQEIKNRFPGDVFVIIHKQEERDQSDPVVDRVITGEYNGYGSIMHESGHAIFGLADEYDDTIINCKGGSCQTTYFSSEDYPNIFTSKNICEAKSKNKDRCREVTQCEDCWWKGQPDENTMMACCKNENYPWAVCDWGPDAMDRIDYVFNTGILGINEARIKTSCNAQASSSLNFNNTQSHNNSATVISNAATYSNANKSIVCLFLYNGANITLLNAVAVNNPPPNRYLSWDTLKITSKNSYGEIVDQFTIGDPRYRDGDYPEGAILLDEAKFTLVLPFIENIKDLEIIDTQSGVTIGTFDLTETVRTFCNGNPNAPECLSYDPEGDGIADRTDNCPNKPNGPTLGTCSATSDKPNINCTSDADCVIGCSTNGKCSLNQEDTDGDGVGDVCDNCPNDPNKTEPGICGCGTLDTDSDSDGIADCVDNCPTVCNPEQKDANNNGIGDLCDPNPGCGGCSGIQCEQACGI